VRCYNAGPFNPANTPPLLTVPACSRGSRHLSCPKTTWIEDQQPEMDPGIAAVTSFAGTHGSAGGTSCKPERSVPWA